MKKFMLGSILTFLVNYCIGATYLIYKGVGKNVRANRTNASTIN